MTTSPEATWPPHGHLPLHVVPSLLYHHRLECKIRTQEVTETIQATTLPEYIHLLHEYFGLEIEGAFIR